MPNAFVRLQPHVTNQLPEIAPRVVTGIIGDRPSQYAKTPVLWNAVFREFEWDAVSQPWDLESSQLSTFLEAARQCEDLLGFSVTVPFKTAVVPLLDDLDPLARDVGAVNTVVRQSNGYLVGSNTDAQGAIDAITGELPGRSGRFLDTVKGRRVVLIGAGGAARAVAFALATEMGNTGSLSIVNRAGLKAEELATAVCHVHGIGKAASETDLNSLLAKADLVVNASTKGQAGWRQGSAGGAFILEPYSALAPASPMQLDASVTLDSRASREWFVSNFDDINSNAQTAREAIRVLSDTASCFDLVYAPLETRFLADARLAGHQTMNGKWMNIGQAADAFVRKVCAPELDARGIESEVAYRTVFERMAGVW